MKRSTKMIPIDGAAAGAGVAAYRAATTAGSLQGAAPTDVDWSKFLPKPTGPYAVERATGIESGLVFDTYSFSDPELQHQWHLGYFGDLETVWKDYTGKGVSVGIYDSGTQSTHWDLAANYDASKHVVIDGVAIDGFRLRDGVEAHGTAVGGIIAAARNGEGGVGIAYDASITGVDIFDPDSKIFVDGSRNFLSAMRQATNFDVVNHSWGNGPRYASDNSRLVPGNFQSALTEAVTYAADVGRGGLGTISVFAAGNNTVDGSGESSKSDRHQIAVAAYRELDGNATAYSTRGPNLLVSAPSNDFQQLGGRGTVTTDITGTAGYNIFNDPGGAYDYTDTFGGTSSAAPKVSAVIALMLDANEGLGWRDVHEIIAASSRMPVAFETGLTSATGEIAEQGGGVRRIELVLNNSSFAPSGAQAHWNGGRMHYSTDYGYGAADAFAAVRMAEVWSLFGPAKTSANEIERSSRTFDVGLTSTAQPGVGNTLDTAGNGFIGTPERFTFDMRGGIDLEHADMTISFSSRYALDPKVVGGFPDPLFTWANAGMKLKLTAPDGSSAFVDTDGAPALITSESGEAQSFTFGFAGMRHADSAGTWTMEFEQVIPRPLQFFGLVIPYAKAETTIHSLKMDLYGSAPSADDVHTYTDEFFTMLAIEGEGGRRELSDRNGGQDWVNAAAVTADVNLSLVEGVRSTFDNRTAFTVQRNSRIEHAVTGDGNDRLTGNALDNKLYAMRGNDWLNGGIGDDTLYGGQGGDVFAFDTLGVSGYDRILDWSTGDRIATSKQLRGADQNGQITVGSNAILLLDNSARGDTAELVEQGGAVLQAMGRSNGYWWYRFVSDGAEDYVDGRVRELALGQTGRPAADALAGAPAAAMTGVEATLQETAFFLYDTMGDTMAGGVQLYA